MALNMKIKMATICDVPVILQMIRELADYEQLLHEVVASEKQLADTLFCDNPHAKALLATIEGEPIGFVIYFYNYSTFHAKYGIYIEDLYIRPSHRGKGYGKELLQYLCQIAIKEDCSRLQWWVLDWNKSAIEFYQSLGAVAMDEWTVFRMTEEKMRKLIGN